MYHLQDLRSSKSPTFRFWETRFTPNKPFWPLTEAQKVPLSGFERPVLPQISLSDHLLKPKMSHFQDLRSSKVPLLGFESPYLPQNGPLSGFEKFKISGEQTLKPLHLATNSRVQVPSIDPTSWLHLSTSISVQVASYVRIRSLLIYKLSPYSTLCRDSCGPQIY